MRLIQHFGELGAVVRVRDTSRFDAWKDGCWIGKFDTLNHALYALLLEGGALRSEPRVSSFPAREAQSD